VKPPGWQAVAVATGASIFGVILDYLVNGLGAQSFSMSYSWVQEEVFLEAYGVARPPPVEQGGYSWRPERTSLFYSKPSCFGIIPQRRDQPPPRPQLACEDRTFVNGVVGDFDEGHLCNPLLDIETRAWRLPFMPQDVELTYFAAGPNKAAELTAALEAARALARDKFGQLFAPNYSHQRERSFEMLVYDGPNPAVDTVDCGDYSIIRTTTTVRNP